MHTLCSLLKISSCEALIIPPRWFDKSKSAGLIRHEIIFLLLRTSFLKSHAYLRNLCLRILVDEPLDIFFIHLSAD